MKCAHCKRADRALFARLISGRTYIVLCDVCLRQKNEQILLELDHLRPGLCPRKAHGMNLGSSARLLKTAHGAEERKPGASHRW